MTEPQLGTAPQFGTTPQPGTALDTVDSNRAGRTSALTTLSTLPRFWVVPLKLLLRVKSRLGPDKMLRRLSFIHIAHWVVIDRLPFEKVKGKYSRLLFVSNFNGSWFDYIDVFSAAVPQKMALLWGSSFGYPGAQPPKPFTNYIRQGDQHLDHFYSAYPAASSTEIASATRVNDAYEARVAPALAGGGDEAARAWRSFLDTVQRDL